jgi:superfamily II DNA or RNA helicase
MPWKCEQVHEADAGLPPAQSAEEYALHQAALEWSLAEPIIIQSAEDIKSRVGWQDRLEPFAHQVQNLFTFCRRLPVTLLADDVGLGKTISAGLILSELMVRRRVARALVICPKILAPQWKEELDEKFGITATVALGQRIASELRGQTPVVITTYDTARQHLGTVESGAFDMLVLDEAHKLRNLYGTQAPPALAVRVRQALEQRLFRYVLMLTATPLQNRLWDLYSLIDCLTVARGHRNPLGTAEQFRERFIQPGTDGRRVQPARVEEFRGHLRNYLVRTRRDDARLKFPARRVQCLPVRLTAGECRLMELVGRNIQGLNALQQTTLAQALMSSPQALAVQMENMARTGKVSASAAVEAKQIAGAIAEPAKLAGLLKLLRELRAARPGNWRAVVFTLRRETQEVIGRAVQREGMACGYIRGDNASGNQRSLALFRAEPPGAHVLVSTDAGAEGINLQVANVVVNYDLPWNPMIVEQRVGRVQRLASRHEYVVVCNLVAAGSPEERVVARLMEKLQLAAHVIGDIEAILEAASPDGDDSDGEGFAGTIRELVVRSLIGQNVEAAAAMARESIDQARRHLEERRQELDDTLGRLDSLHATGPAMPRLSRGTPSVPAKEFVLRAKKAEGAAVQQIGRETYDARLPGRSKEVITFDERVLRTAEGQGVFMGNAPRLYLPGKPFFERLTQHWIDRAGHLVRDLRPHDVARAESLARDWCTQVPGAQFQRAQFVPTQLAFQGFVVIKARTANAVDSYEKLIRGRIGQQSPDPCPPSGGPAVVLAGPARLSEFVPQVKAAVASVVEADHDVGEFCRFYDARLQEEIAKAAGDARKEHKVRSDFTPLVHADVVALEGARYAVGVLDVWFALDGRHSYQVRLEAIPATHQILKQPERAKCEATGRVVPEPCLASCALSGKRVLKHLLVASDVSGRLAMPECTAVCAVSGKRVLTDELARSALTGRQAAAELFRRSPVSRRLGLPDEFVRCELGGAEVLRDEVVRSQVSGRSFRKDEAVASAISGTVGHRCEFIWCEKTGDTILPTEASRSDLSGKCVRKDLLQASARPPGRRGTEDEIVVCTATRRRLLKDEAAPSAVSGKWFDRDLLRPSAVSGSLALPAEMVTCEESGAVLLPVETATCALTGKRVDRRLLRASQASGALALKQHLVQCAKTHKWVLPAELVVCDVTQQRVLPSEVEFCAVTGRRALRDRLLKSSVSERYALPEKAVRSVLSNAVGMPDEMIDCAWLEGPILKAKSGVCRLTGCTVAQDWLNEAGELAELRKLLNGDAVGAREDFRLGPWLAGERPRELANLKQVWCLPSPNRGVVAVCAEQRTWLGLKTRHVGLLVRIREPRAILCEPITGRRTPAGWVAGA